MDGKISITRAKFNSRSK